MCKKLIYLISFVLVLGLTTGVASADPLQQDPGPDGIVSIEAENFDEYTPQGDHTWDFSTEWADFSGIGAMRAMPDSGTNNNTGYETQSPRLDFEVNFVKTGTHYVWIRGYAIGGSDDSCHVAIDAIETGGGNGDRIQAGSAYNKWEWSLQRREGMGPAQIEVASPGVHVISLWMREDGLAVDKIVLTTNADYTPTDEGPEESLRGPRVKAYHPIPEDGELYSDTWANLIWSAAPTGASHDVYFGENFDDVNDGTEGTFQGNQATTFFVVGFPGFSYPDGLVPGTTYYWRIDEVEPDGTTKHKGHVWSFAVPPRIAYNPIPADEGKFIDPNTVELSWTGGFGAKLHTVYFGDNFDDVNNAAGGLPQGPATYTPGPLKLAKTYYWRIDEFDPPGTYKGEVWSFTTAGLGGGVRGDYFKGMDLRNFVLTRIDPQINFNWGSGAPDPAVGEDNFSVRWTGEVEAAFTETYTFYTNSDDGIRLWVDGQQLVNNWTDHGPTENKGTIDLVAGNTYSVVMEMYENGGGAVAELRWSSPSTPKQLIPQAALSLPVKASRSKPSNGAVDVKQTQILNWSPGDYAVSHQVYFGTDAEAVKNANTGSTEYKGTRDIGSESYDPGKLEWDTTYYWRVDEVNNVNPDSPWIGNVWSFTTANFLVVDDFEDYDVGNNQIWYVWHDGLGYGAPGTEPYFAGNGTGSMVGDESTGSYCEETIVHGGSQSMPVFYDNSVLKYSEVEKTLSYPRDWTEKGINTLTIWFRGISDNAVEPLYVALNGSAVVSHDNPNAAQIDKWTRWNIDLQAFGVNLANVNTIALGLGNKKNPQAGGSGTMYFDDIRLYPPAP